MLRKIFVLVCFIVIVASLIFLFFWNNKQSQVTQFLEEKKFVIVIPSYNNSEWYKKTLDSVFAQKYSNYRIIYIDDCSSDNSYELAKAYIEQHGYSNRVTLIRNDVNRGAMANHFRAGHMCNNDEIIVDLDGDDWLKHEYVLQRLNQEYANPNTWMTYGQFEIYPGGRIGYCKEIPAVIHEKGLYREYEWVSAHLRSFYAWLFKCIKLEDCLHHGKWLPIACDKLIMFSLLEMAREHSKFIPDILYVYNCATPINDYKVRMVLQRYYNQVICAGKKYPRINQAPSTHQKSNNNVNMLIFSKDNPFLLYTLLESAQKYLSGYSHIHVLYHASTEAQKQAYQEFATLFNDVTFHSYNQTHSSSLPHIIEQLLNQTPYVLFAHDGIIINTPINLCHCIQALRDTHAYGFYLTLGTNITKNHHLRRQQKQPPLIDLDNQFYAWQFSCGEYDWKKPQTFSLGLYRTTDIKKAISCAIYDSPDMLEDLWRTASFDMNHVGLIGNSSAAFILDPSICPSLSLNLFKERFKLDITKCTNNKSVYIKKEVLLQQEETIC